MKKNILKIILFILIITAVFAVFKSNIIQYLNLDYIKAQQQFFVNFYEHNAILTVAIFTVIYIVATGLSLPGAAVLTLLAGALFGFLPGTIIVSFSSTIGATIAFLSSRFIIGSSVQQKYGQKLQAINDGIEKEGAFYLFALRLVPVFPFFLINILMGLTKIKTATYFFTSQIGMLPGTMAFVYAGTQLAKIHSLSGILSPRLLLAFTILGLLPLISKKIVNYFRIRKMYMKYKVPKNYDYNIAVIGAGSGGLVASYIASALKAKVVLVEKHKQGGDCLNTGCVPSKAFIQSAKIAHYIKNSNNYGLKNASVDFDFAKIMDRVQDKIQKIAPHDSVERYTSLGVDCITGEAEIIDPYRIKVNNKVITAKNIIIATGASPLVPPILGLKDIDYLTSDNLWDLREQPKNLAIIGGGPIGCEIAQSFARLGTKVTMIEAAPQIMIREDEEVCESVKEKFESEGIKILTGYLAKQFGKENETGFVICESGENTEKVYFDKVIVALGRKANVTGFGLEKLGVNLRKNGTVETDGFLRTNFPNIYACGDVTGPYQFTHTAAFQAWFASVNALFSPIKAFKTNYNLIPWSTFTDPEVARVGLNEKDAKTQGIKYEVTKYDLSDLDRAITDNVDYGFVKVITKPGTDKILGVTIMGEHAGDLIAEFVLAMNYGIGLNKILNTIHIYPTLAEANKFAAGNWKKAHKPEEIMNLLEKFNKFRRNSNIL